MTYEEFTEEFKRELSGRADEFGIGQEDIEYYMDGYAPDEDNEMDLMLVRETNIKYHKIESDVLIGDFLVLHLGDEFSQMARFEMKHLYQCEEGKGWELVWKNITENIRLTRIIRESDVLRNIHDYDIVKEKLIVRPLNFSDHRMELNNAIYKRVGDMCLVLYILMYDKSAGGRHDIGSTKVQRNLLDVWKVNEEQIWETAMGNSYLIAPPRIYFDAMDTKNPPYTKGAFMAMGDETVIHPLQVPIVTTTMQLNGAVAMFYPGVMKRISDMIGGDYLVAFTSTSEARIHKCGTIKPIVALRRLKDVNKMFPREELLSQKLYMYESGSGEFKQLEL